jgi:hypothetical protein
MAVVIMVSVSFAGYFGGRHFFGAGTLLVQKPVAIPVTVASVQKKGDFPFWTR